MEVDFSDEVCPNCGDEIGWDGEFCDNCGYPYYHDTDPIAA